MPQTVAVTDHIFEDLDIERSIVSEFGAELVELDATTEDAVIERAAGADGLVVNKAPMTRRVFENLPDLRVVARYGSGYENVDLDAATEHGVVVTTVPEYCVDEVATHALSMLLSCHRRLKRFDADVARGEWDWRAHPDMVGLGEQTLGIVGFGNTGRRLAELVSGLPADVVAYSESTDRATMAEYGVEKVDFGELLDRATLVSIHTALVDRTRNLFDADAFARMDESAVLCNTARGGIVDQDALLSALDDGEIALAALDVLETEPPAPDDPIRDREDVLVTPHVAWYSQTATGTLRRTVADDVVRVLAGERPEHPVNPSVLDA